MKVFLLIFISIILVTSVSLAINHPSFGYGGGGGGGGGGSGSTLDSRVCGDKLCSEIPGGREAWESSNTREVESELSNTEQVSSLSNSPKHQIANGVLPKDVICKEHLELIFKSTDGTPVCVKPETAKKLIERGWEGMPSPISSIDSFEECVAAGNLVMESYPRQCRTSDGKHFVESILTQSDSPKTEQSKNCSGNARCISGLVTQIVDGDTINVDNESIRFALTSTPELNEYGGQEAKEFLEKICPVGSQVLVDEDDGQTEGSYGRIVGVVYCNDMNLNEVIMDADLGYLSSGFCYKSEFSTHAWAQRHGC